MASVILDFTPPIEPNIASLHIYESDAADGVFNEIEEVTDIGTYPTYITRYETTAATNNINWFKIAWESAGGAMSPQSEPWQGGTVTVVGEIISRAMLRDSMLDENIVRQEAEAVLEIESGMDPYTLNIQDYGYAELSGLTLLTMARAYISSFIQETRSSTDDYVAGLVSQKSGSSQGLDMKLIDQLVAQANKILGRNYSAILLLEPIEVAGLTTNIGEITIDQSRLVYMIEKA